MALVSTSRRQVSELIKTVIPFQHDYGVDYSYKGIPVEGSGAYDPIGQVLQWSESDSAFLPIAAPATWAVTTAYVLGNVVQPTVLDGNEYVCVAAGTSAGTEPTWVTVDGATLVDGTATWLTRPAFSGTASSGLPDNTTIAISVGTAEGVGFNVADVTLSATAVTLTALYRGPAGISNSGIVWDTFPAGNQAEVLVQLEKQGLALVVDSTVVVPSFVL